MNICIDSVMLPKIGLNRRTPKAVMYGPMKLGGLNYPQFKTLQTAKSITYLLKQMRCNGDMAAAIRVKLEMTHLMSGVEAPILEQTDQSIDYLPESWVLTILKRLKALKAKVWIENIWRQEKQWVNDLSIMEALTKIPGVRRHNLRQQTCVEFT